jgi:CheY-like chemotaxis protein
VHVRLTVAGLSEALPSILATLGERLPDDLQTVHDIAAKPVEDLLLVLHDPKIRTRAGKRRVTAMATLVYEPAAPTMRRVESRRFTFTAPLGPIKADDLRWYLESYYLWPTGVFKARAERIEAQLPQWGQGLYHTVVATKHAQEALHAWQHAVAGAERRFSVLVDSDLPDGSSPKAQAAAKEAATGLLALPWELLHDGRSYLFQGQHAVRVRRRLPNRYAQPHAVTDLPIRILLVSPRPENAHTSYIDHRISALPLVEATESLGKLAELTVLTPPTFPALQQALQHAAAAKQPFDVVHFDGHGVYDRRHGCC